MPFCVGHSQLGAAYQCLNSAALKHQQQQQQPATRTTIQHQREEEEEACNSEKQQKVNLNILRRHFMIISHDTQARVLEPPPIAHRASHLPLGPSWLRSFLHIAGRRVALLATCCQRLQASNLAPFPHFPFSISHFSVFAAFLEFSSRGRSYEVFAVPQRENLKCTRAPFFSARCEFKANSSY